MLFIEAARYDANAAERDYVWYLVDHGEIPSDSPVWRAWASIVIAEQQNALGDFSDAIEQLHAAKQAIVGVEDQELRSRLNETLLSIDCFSALVLASKRDYGAAKDIIAGLAPAEDVLQGRDRINTRLAAALIAMGSNDNLGMLRLANDADEFAILNGGEKSCFRTGGRFLRAVSLARLNRTNEAIDEYRFAASLARWSLRPFEGQSLDMAARLKLETDVEDGLRLAEEAMHSYAEVMPRSYWRAISLEREMQARMIAIDSQGRRSADD